MESQTSIKTPVRTRIAPSPTGELHIGHVRTSLYDYAFAKKYGGQFIVRIEDTDRSRYVEGSVDRTLDVLAACGLIWDEGPRVEGPYAPYSQSERLPIYKKYADELIAKGHAYYCFCTEERLTALRDEQTKAGAATTKYDKKCLSLSADEVAKRLASGEKYVIRLDIPANRGIKFRDEVLGELVVNSNELDDQVLMKSDGFPTYHLAVVVDDYLMKINYIMRGVDWLPSTPKHVLLYEFFGWELPKFVHLPLLKEMGENRKLSKRYGAVAAVEFLQEGYLPEALLNFLMFLGWNPGTDREIYSLSEFVADFSIERLQKTDLVSFDRTKLAWYNGQYIRELSTDKLLARVREWAAKFGVNLVYGEFGDEYILQALVLVQDRMKLLSEFNELTKYFFEEPAVDSGLLLEQTKDEGLMKEILNTYYEVLSGVTETDWNREVLDKLCHEKLAVFGYKPKQAFMTLRVAVCGVTATPPLFDVFAVLGRDVVLKRLGGCL